MTKKMPNFLDIEQLSQRKNEKNNYFFNIQNAFYTNLKKK